MHGLSTRVRPPVMPSEALSRAQAFRWRFTPLHHHALDSSGGLHHANQKLGS